MQEIPRRGKLAARLDLADEATAVLRGDADIELSGVSEEVERRHDMLIHRIRITDERGCALLGRPRGQYITVDLPPLDNSSVFTSVIAQTARELNRLLPPLHDGLLLIVGLGNPRVLADSLGPQTVGRCYATAQLFHGSSGHTPDSSRIGRVCLSAPGVEGCSGINTCELICSLCDRLKPDALIAVDALAAGSVSRVGTTIQLSDSGIRPGSGSDSRNALLSPDLIGCPLAAIGVPTVIDSSAIIDEMLSALNDERLRRGQQQLPLPDDDEREYAEKKLREVFRTPLTLTPEDIDELIANQAEIIAAACAIYAHPACSAENYADFIR